MVLLNPMTHPAVKEKGPDIYPKQHQPDFPLARSGGRPPDLGTLASQYSPSAATTLKPMYTHMSPKLCHRSS